MSQTETHVGSIDGQEHEEVQKKVKSRRPASTLTPMAHRFVQRNEDIVQRLMRYSALYRYRLPATAVESMAVSASPSPRRRFQAQQQVPLLNIPLHRPILTPKTVLPLFFAVGIIFAPIGGLLLYASAQVQEIVIDYSHCHELQNGTQFTDTGYVDIPSNYTSSSFKGSDSNCTAGSRYQWKQYSYNKTYAAGTAPVNTSVCSLQFNIPDNLNPPVLLYYRLTNFYQNHRRYVKSLDSDQLKGTAVSNGSLGACDPLNTDSAGRPYYPCGLIANSLFNDSIGNPVQLNTHYSNAPNITYNMTEDGIAWSSDAALYSPTQYNYSQIAVPPNWYLRWQNGYNAEAPPPDLKTDYAFQVWMRTAGLPNFSKLAKRNDNETMQCSTYQVDIDNNFPVTVYGGTKSIVISTRTVMGGKNPFLGIAYVAVGGICIVLGTIFTVTHLIKPRKLGDHTYLSWNNDQPSTATATGIQRPGNDTA